MANLNFAVNDPLAVKLWSKDLERDTLQKLWFKDLLGESSNSIIRLKRDLNKSQGDYVRFPLRGLLSGRGKTEGQVLFGNEEEQSYTYDGLYVNELRHATAIPGDTNISQQRFVLPDLRDEGKDLLSEWMADRMEVAVFNHLGGQSHVTDGAYTGNNTTLAPSANRIIRVAGQATDAAIGNTNLLTLSVLDVAVEMASTLSPRIKPGMVNGKERFVLFVHPYQVTDLMRATGTGEWLGIQLAKLQGGDKSEKLQSYEGYIGSYKNIEIYATKYVPTGVNASTGAAISTVRRALLCGRSAAMVAFAKGTGKSMFTWAEESKDYGHDIGIAASTIWGVKKTRFGTNGTDGEDYGVISIASYAVAHTS